MPSSWRGLPHAYSQIFLLDLFPNACLRRLILDTTLAAKDIPIVIVMKKTTFQATALVKKIFAGYASSLSYSIF